MGKKSKNIDTPEKTMECPNCEREVDVKKISVAGGIVLKEIK